MRPLVAMTATAVRDVLHQKLLYGVLVVAVGFILSSLALVHLTIGQWERLVTDIGVSSIGISTTLVAVFFGASCISREVERKTLYFVLSKRVSRASFLLSKLSALALVILLIDITLLLVVGAVLFLTGYRLGYQAIAAAMGGFLEAVMLAAIAAMFSSFTTSTLAAIYTLAFFVIGHLIGQVSFVTAQASPALRAIGGVLSTVMPNFELVNFKRHAVDQLPVGGRDLGYAAVYAAGYVAIFYILAVLAFRRRDLR